MRVLVQRVTWASVDALVDGALPQRVAEVGPGLLAMVGVAPADTVEVARRLAAKVARLRVLEGERCLAEGAGALLVVSQFTLYADAGRGRRPSYSGAASSVVAAPLVEEFVRSARGCGVGEVATGRFGAHMRVRLENDGPVTLLLEG